MCHNRPELDQNWADAVCIHLQPNVHVPALFWPSSSPLWLGHWANNDHIVLICGQPRYQWHVASEEQAHYTDFIMTTMASQITSLTVVYSTVYSDADQRKHQSSASLAFVGGIHRDRWIPHTKGQLHGKCFHSMMSSCNLLHGPDWDWFNIKYRKSCGNKTVIRSSYLHSGNSYSSKTSLYWIFSL